MKNLIEILRNEGKPKTFGAIDIIKNIGPGLLVTVGFIDPGNWASNFAAGSSYGYVLLWVVTLSTIMLIALQHNVAHLGNNAANIFAIALFLAGISSTITSGMAAGCIFSGMFGEQYYAKDAHSIVGICLSLGLALLVIFFVGDPFKGLLYSQMVLSIQ